MFGLSVFTTLAISLSLVSRGGAFNLGEKRVQDDKPLSIGYVRSLSAFVSASHGIM
jgi:hypothetical protein